jgi:hypothetical protein
MKILVLMVVFTLLASAVLAQGISDLFNQKKKQLKLLEQEIAELELYRLVLEQGYQIVEKGNGVIGEIKRGDLDLHSDHFDSLKKVKPAIRDDPRVKSAMDLSGRVRTLALELRMITERWADLAQRVSDMLNAECDKDSVILARVTKDGDLQMTDDERLEEIERVYRHQKELFVLASQTAQEMRMQQNGMP